MAALPARHACVAGALENEAALRTRRVLLMEGFSVSLRLPEAPAAAEAGHKEGGARPELSDGVFLRLMSLPKGKALIARALRLVYPPPEALLPQGEGQAEAGAPQQQLPPNLRVMWAVMRNLRALFGGRAAGGRGGKVGRRRAVHCFGQHHLLTAHAVLRCASLLCWPMEAASPAPTLHRFSRTHSLSRTTWRLLPSWRTRLQTWCGSWPRHRQCATARRPSWQGTWMAPAFRGQRACCCRFLRQVGELLILVCVCVERGCGEACSSQPLSITFARQHSKPCSRCSLLLRQAAGVRL